MKKTEITCMIAIIAIVKLSAGNRLNNDICSSVKMNNISSSTAQILCNKDTKIFDPMHQSGLFLFDKNTGSWNKSGIFSCLCSCHLTKIKNGHILPQSIGNGEAFNYKCNEGFYKTIKGKIICFDGVLTLAPDNLEDISIAFRQKWLINKFQGIFPLAINETSSWTIPETEVGSNQKYFQSLGENETVLVLYFFNGLGYKIGIVDLKTRLEPECIRTESVLSAGAIAGIISGTVVAVLIVIIVVVYFWKQKRYSRYSEPPTGPNETDQMYSEPPTGPNETDQM